MADRLTLTGDENVPALPMTDAEVNHLRRLMAWMRCEWMLDEDAQRGFLTGASECVEAGFASAEQAGEIVKEQADKIAALPLYVRQAVKMLTEAVREHDRKSRIIDAEPERQL